MALARLRFRIVVLHFSLFGMWPIKLTDRFCSYIEDSESSYKVAFFQDEYWNCQERFELIDRFQIDCVYTRLRPPHDEKVYRKNTRVSKTYYTLAGYVSDDLIDSAQRLTKPARDRSIDIGYRSRKLPFFIGKAGQEKHEIAEGFSSRAAHLSLRLDISVEEHQRIYGKAWYDFLADSRGCLGVEGGSSVFDIEGVVQKRYGQLVSANPEIGFAEVYETVLRPWEDRIPYRSFTPRHFEAAAFRVCQVQFRGDYSGMMEAQTHYISLEKDFSDFDEAIRMFTDVEFRHQLTERAFDDLIASGQYSYRRFLESFDENLENAGLEPGYPSGRSTTMTALLRAHQASTRLRMRSRHYVLKTPFPGREHVKRLVYAVSNRQGWS